jgi:thymidine kinase
MTFGWAQRPNSGWIEVVCGSMFSGKTEELIRRLKLAAIARQRVQIFKSARDDRYGEKEIVSHSDNRLHSDLVHRAEDILAKLHPKTQVVGIDEAQFLGEGLVRVCQMLADRGARVIVAGLDQDYRGEPFEPMPALLAVAESITKLNAVCVTCGGPANRTQRLTAEAGRVLVGAAESYEARCRRCHEPNGNPQIDFLPRPMAVKVKHTAEPDKHQG